MIALGYISSFLLIACGIPELIKGIKNGEVGASKGLIYTWFAGEVFGLIYVTYIGDYPLLLNYGLNTIITGALSWIKYKENK